MVLVLCIKKGVNFIRYNIHNLMYWRTRNLLSFELLLFCIFFIKNKDYFLKNKKIFAFRFSNLFTGKISCSNLCYFLLSYILFSYWFMFICHHLELPSLQHPLLTSPDITYTIQYLLLFATPQALSLFFPLIYNFKTVLIS